MVSPSHRQIRVTLAGLLEEQRLDKGGNFSGLLSSNVPGQTSIVGCLGPLCMALSVGLELFT